MPRKGHSFNLKNLDFKLLLKNKNALYVVLFLAVANLFSYLMMKQLDAVVFFVIIGFLTTYFSKNMIVVMLTSMISTFLLVQLNLLGKVQEGMGSRAEGTSEAAGTSEAGTSEAGTTGAAAETSGAGTSAAGTTGAAAATAATDEKTQEVLTNPPDATIPIGKEDRAAITAGNAKPKPESFQQQLNPARYNSADDDDTPRHKPKIDYAATLENAYDNLDKLLSSDAIRNMTADTGRLAEKQQKLMGNIEKITPIMDKASSILQNLDIGNIMGGLQDKLSSVGGMQEKLKGFMGKQDETTA
jgi:hypothetical protein